MVQVLDLFSPNACKKLPILDLFMLSFYYCWTFSPPECPYLGPFSLNSCKRVPILDLFLLSFYCFVDLFPCRRSMSWTFFLRMLARRYPYWISSSYLFTVLWTFSSQKVHVQKLVSKKATNQGPFPVNILQCCGPFCHKGPCDALNNSECLQKGS